jgi:hypothetical protein
LEHEHKHQDHSLDINYEEFFDTLEVYSGNQEEDTSHDGIIISASESEDEKAK